MGSKFSYITPKPMSKHSETLMRVLICTFQTITTGNAARIKSVRMESTAIVTT